MDQATWMIITKTTNGKWMFITKKRSTGVSSFPPRVKDNEIM